MIAVPVACYPVVVVQDRYSGTYSGGFWFAVREADTLIDRLARSHWVLEYGPGGDDDDAAEFWGDPPNWVAVGLTLEEAVRKLTLSSSA